MYAKIHSDVPSFLVTNARNQTSEITIFRSVRTTAALSMQQIKKNENNDIDIIIVSFSIKYRYLYTKLEK